MGICTWPAALKLLQTLVLTQLAQQAIVTIYLGLKYFFVTLNSGPIGFIEQILQF